MKKEVKERFSISLSPKALKWIDDLCERKIFSSRTHGVEFCVEQFVGTSFEEIMTILWKNPETINIPKHEMELIDGVVKDFDFMTKEEAVVYAVRRLKEDKRKEPEER